MSATIDNGATPLAIAVEANSAAHHALDEARDIRREHAAVHVSLREMISRVQTDLSDLRGELKGSGRTTRLLISIAGFVVACIAAVAPFVARVRP